MKLIDKDALLAEIEKLESLFQNVSNEDYSDGYHYSLKLVKRIINASEVKEVDLRKEVANWKIDHQVYGMDETFYSIAKHFFELGMQQSKNDNNNEEKK